MSPALLIQAALQQDVFLAHPLIHGGCGRHDAVVVGWLVKDKLEKTGKESTLT
jgi:hypothetical protein